VCVYRSPDGDFHIFLRNLELVIQKVLSERKKLILCGDWNINFMKESAELNEVKNILLMYILINTVITPTRVTEITKSLLHVIIINKENHINPATVLDLGFLDQQAQILCIHVDNPKSGLVKTVY
jgi:exonuclease III